MAYYFRVFCTSDTVPTLGDVLAWVKERGVTLGVETGEMAAWGDSPVALRYAADKAPFLVELNRNEGPDSLAAQEINEFLEQLAEVKKTPRKRNQVVEQLQKTRFLVACQVPIQDFTDEGFHALDVFLAYFVVHSGGMVQADGQGFYDRGKLIIETEAA